MESTGQRGKIQVSEATAMKLRAGGKDSWLAPREDLVEAKGKGTLQTYWVEPIRGANAAVSNMSKTLSTSEDSCEEEENESPKFQPTLPTVRDVVDV